MNSKPKKQSISTNAAGNRPKVELKDLKPKKNPKAGALNAYISKVIGEKQGGGS